MLRARLGAWVVGMLLLAPGLAAAQQDHSLAVSHFDRGLVAMKSGDFATGCPALAESYRLDKRPGTLFTLADCEASWGKVASALAHFNDYMEWYERMPPDQKASQRGRQDVAPERQRDLKSRVPFLTIKPAGAAANAADVEIEMDGTTLGAGSLGVALPIDPGAHEVVVKAKGYEPRATKFEIAEREQKELAVEPGNALPSDVVVSGGSKSRWSNGKTVAVGAAGVAVVGLGLGTVFGLITMGHKDTIESNCIDTVCRDQTGIDAADAASTTGAISTAGFVIAGGALALAAVFWFTAPKASSTATARAFARPFALSW